MWFHANCNCYFVDNAMTELLDRAISLTDRALAQIVVCGTNVPSSRKARLVTHSRHARLAMRKHRVLRYAELKKLPDGQQNEVAMMIFKQIQPHARDKLSSLWQKVDELGTDEEQPTIEEITTIVKQVRHSRN